MAYKQNPLKYSRTSNMPGVEFADEDISMKERLATNAFGVTPPEDLLDGEFFLKDNDPQDFYRTLYIKRGENLDKVVTFTDTGKAIFDGVNEINLDDDEEVKGVLPKRKIITASATVPMDNIQNIIAYDGNKFQEVAKSDLTNKIVEQVNAGIDLTNYFNKTTDKINLTSQVEDVLPVANGGHGANNINDARKNLQTFRQSQFPAGADLNDIEYYKREITIKHYNAGLINRPTQAAESGDYITSIQPEFKRGWQIFKEIGISENGSFREYGRLYNNGVWGEWKLLRNLNGTIPASCGGVLTKYENSNGVWTETLLETGEIMLEGGAKITLTSKASKTINLPKSIDLTKIILLNTNVELTTSNIISNTNIAIGSTMWLLVNNTSTTEVSVRWSFKGILAK